MFSLDSSGSFRDVLQQLRNKSSWLLVLRHVEGTMPFFYSSYLFPIRPSLWDIAGPCCVWLYLLESKDCRQVRLQFPQLSADTLEASRHSWLYWGGCYSLCKDQREMHLVMYNSVFILLQCLQTNLEGPILSFSLTIYGHHSKSPSSTP